MQTVSRQTSQSRPSWLIPIAVTTAVYLVFELAFNARLLDVTGGLATRDEVTSIERWGRVLSGVAFTLAVWGSWLLPRAETRHWTRSRTVAVLLLTAAAAMSIAFYGERALVDRIVDRSDGVTRRAAAHLAAVTGAIQRGAAAIDGIDLSGDQIRRPEGKSLVAILPFVALSTNNLEAKSETVLRAVLRETAVSELGSAEESWNSAFIPSVKAVKEMFNAYVDGSEKRAAAIAQTQRRQSSAWADYEADLRRNGLSPGRVSQSQRSQVVSSVRGRGIDVPQNWSPGDQDTFYRAVASKVQREADAAFRAGVSASVGGDIPPGLEFRVFQANTGVQARWREKIGAPAAGVRLSNDMGFSVFRDGIWKPTIDAVVDARARALLQPAASYQDGGERAGEGRLAMEALAVPPVALSFSLLGALVHIFKSFNFLARIAVPAMRLRKTCIGLAVVSLAVLPWFMPNDVSRSATFSYLEHQTSERISPAASAAARWTVQAQPWFYPVNETVRKTLLMGFGFGYSPSGHGAVHVSSSK